MTTAVLDDNKGVIKKFNNVDDAKYFQKYMKRRYRKQWFGIKLNASSGLKLSTKFYTNGNRKYKSLTQRKP